MGGKFLQCFTYQWDTADICFQPHQRWSKTSINFVVAKLQSLSRWHYRSHSNNVTNIHQDPKIYSDAETRGLVLIDKTKPCSFYTRCLILRTLCVIFHKVAHLRCFVVNFRAYACTKFSGLNVQWCNKKWQISGDLWTGLALFSGTCQAFSSTFLATKSDKFQVTRMGMALSSNEICQILFILFNMVGIAVSNRLFAGKN